MSMLNAAAFWLVPTLLAWAVVMFGMRVKSKRYLPIYQAFGGFFAVLSMCMLTNLVYGKPMTGGVVLLLPVIFSLGMFHVLAVERRQ